MKQIEVEEERVLSWDLGRYYNWQPNRISADDWSRCRAAIVLN